MTESISIDALRRDIAGVQVSVAHLTERIDRLLEARDDEKTARVQLDERITAIRRDVDALQARLDRAEGGMAVIRWLSGLVGVAGGGGGAAGLYALWQQVG